MISQAERSLAFKLDDAASYDAAVAERFGQLTDRFTVPIADRVVALAGLASPQRVLDVGTGTGVVALRAAQRIAPGGKVVGIDLSDGMLVAAKARASQSARHELMAFRKMDAEALDVEENSFDAALSMFALLHFPNPILALKEMFRALRPGGVAVVAVGSGPPWYSLSGWMHRAHRLCGLLCEHRGRQLTAPFFLDRLVKTHLASPTHASETAWSSEHPNRAGILPRLMRQAGFVRLVRDWFGQILEVQNPEEFWDLQVTFSSFSRKHLGDMPSAAATSLRADFMERCRRVQDAGGRLVFPCAACIVRGVKPTEMARPRE